VVWVAQALLEIPTGLFSDLVGRKRTTVLGTLLSVVAYVLYAWNPGYWILFLGSILEGGSRALFSGNNNAYLHDLLAGEQNEKAYHHVYGRLNAAIGAAMFVAGLSSGVLIQWAVHLFMWLNLAPQLVALALALSLVEVPRHSRAPNVYAHLKEAVVELRGNVNLRHLSLSQMLGGGGLACYEYQAAVYAAVWPTWAIGLARGVQEAGVVPSFYFAGRITDRLGAVKALTANWLVGTLGIVLAAVVQSVVSPILIMLSLPFYGAGDTSNQQILQREFTDRQRATIASMNAFGNSITFAICLYLCGLIANAYGRSRHCWRHRCSRSPRASSCSSSCGGCDTSMRPATDDARTNPTPGARPYLRHLDVSALSAFPDAAQNARARPTRAPITPTSVKRCMICVSGQPSASK
jgi:MFS family permease